MHFHRSRKWISNEEWFRVNSAVVIRLKPQPGQLGVSSTVLRKSISEIDEWAKKNSFPQIENFLVGLKKPQTPEQQ